MFGRAIVARLLSPIREDGVGVGRIGGKPHHLGSNGRELVDRKIDERGLERGKLRRRRSA